MKNRLFFSILLCMITINGISQTKTIALKKSILVPVNVIASEVIFLGKESVKVVEKEATDNEVKFAKINDLIFRNGTIEVEVAGTPVAGASNAARGFVGIAFRISNDNSKFDCIYLRPANGRADDQLRRNHSVQYISYPSFPWYELRKQFPGKYESYADITSGQWIKIRIEVNGEKAKLFVNDNSQPSLIINDLKTGSDSQGGIGLWIGPGTEAHFTNMQVTY